MAAERTVTVNIDDCCIQLSSNSGELVDFLQRVLARVAASDGTPEVRARLHWAVRGPLGDNTSPLGEGLRRVCQEYLAAGRQVCVPYVPGFPSFSVLYDGLGEGLTVTGRLHYHRVWDGLRTRLGRYYPGYFQTRLMYHMVYMPAAWYLGHRHARYWMHSAAVVRDGQAVLVGGLSGVGKSTLTQRLMERGGFSRLSDDLLFYTDSEVRTCYEPLRTEGDSPAGGQNLVSLGTLGRKCAFEDPAQLIGAAQPVVLVLPRFGGETHLEDLPPSRAADRLFAASRAVPQVAEFDYYANLFCSHHGVDDWFTRQREQLRSLLATTACFSLTQNRADGPDRAYQLLREVTDGIG